MDEFEKKLAEVIQRNTIPAIAAKVEKEQNKLNAVSGKFQQLHPSFLQTRVIIFALLFGQLYQECLVLQRLKLLYEKDFSPC